MIVLALTARATEAAACPSLGEELRARVQPLNLDAPVPSNGALVFLVDCWHACNACQAAEQRLAIEVRNPRGEDVAGDKPEQVMLAEDATRHLVVWRPAHEMDPGAGYEVTVSVESQNDRSSYPLQVTESRSLADPLTLVTPATSTHRLATGARYACDQGQTNCDDGWITFGSAYQTLPALELVLGAPEDPPLSGQLLFQVKHHSASGTEHWGSWHLASHRRTELVRFVDVLPEYCAAVQVRSLLSQGTREVSERVCSPSLDDFVPGLTDADVSSELGRCLRPPAGLEPEWCALHMTTCVPEPLHQVCSEVQRRCAEPIARGTPDSFPIEDDPTATAPAELCAVPPDPYNRKTAACGCRVGARSDGSEWGVIVTSLGIAIAAVRRRRRVLVTCLPKTGPKPEGLR